MSDEAALSDEAERSEFEADTAVERRGDGRWRGEATRRWDVVGGAPNGGYLLTLPLRALAAELDRPDPLTVTAHFLDACGPGPVEISTEVLRTGRHATGRAVLAQADDEPGRARLTVTATFGDLGDADGPTRVDAEPPELPPLEECVDPAAAEVELPPIVRRFDLRLDPSCVGWAVGRPSGVGRMAGWLRFGDGHPIDTMALPLLADALPPPALNLIPEVAWVPTLELTTHVRARPAPGWLRTVFRTRYLVDGYLEEDGELWDAEGRLVALSRQLALVRTRPAET